MSAIEISLQETEALKRQLQATKMDLLVQMSWLEQIKLEFRLQLQVREMLSLSEDALRRHPLLSHVPERNMRELCIVVARVHFHEATIASCERSLRIDADLLDVLLAGKWRQLDKKSLLRAVRAAMLFFNFNRDDLTQIVSNRNDIVQILKFSKKDIFLAERLLEGIRDGRNVLKMSSSFRIKPEEAVKHIGLAVVLEEARRVRK